MEYKKEDIIELYGRSPYIDLDSVYEVVSGVSAKGKVIVSPESEFFNGHFPGKPIMPGVLILDLFAKVSGLIFIAGGNKLSTEAAGFLAGGEDVKFRRAVNPGDTLEIEAKAKEGEGDIKKVECVGKVNGQEVTSCILEIRIK